MTTLTTTFDTETTTRAPDRNLPQKMGRALWLPMWVMGLMLYVVGMSLAGAHAAAIAAGDSPSRIAELTHLQPAFQFLAFTAMFSAISFAIARILGEFRIGGGAVQEAVGVPVQTLRMPTIAKAFIGLMAMAMMIIVGAVVLHFVVAASIAGGSEYALGHSAQWAIWLQAARRFGMHLYLFAIGLGLAAIIYVLRFQANRITDIAAAKH